MKMSNAVTFESFLVVLMNLVSCVCSTVCEGFPQIQPECERYGCSLGEFWVRLVFYVENFHVGVGLLCVGNSCPPKHKSHKIFQVAALVVLEDRFCRNEVNVLKGHCDYFFFFFQGNLHDRYGHIVALSAKFLCNKMEFHAKVRY